MKKRISPSLPPPRAMLHACLLFSLASGSCLASRGEVLLGDE